MKSITVLLLAAILLHTSAQSVVDYSHSDSQQKSAIIESTTYVININPTDINQEYLQFPSSCHLNRKLDSSELAEVKSLQQVNIEDHLKVIKANMTNFLRLSEQIKKNKLYLNELEYSQEINSVKLTLDEDKMDQLQDIQTELLRMNSSITDKIAQLSQLINQEINRTKHNSFDQIQLKFQLNAYESRLKYLQNLKKKQVEPKDGSVNDKQIGQFFKDIDFELDRQNKYLTNLNDLLNSYADNAQFKLKISNLQNQIEALSILIEQKQECLSRRDKLSLHENHHQIEAITNKLRELKQLESPNRHYCEGVAIKLLNQLKKVLKTYNYSFSCAEGLNKLREKKTVVHNLLLAVHSQRDALQYDHRSKRIEQFFNDSHSNKEQKIKEIKQFTIHDYDLNKEVLQNQIAETRQKLRDIQYRLQHPPEGEVKPMDYEKIRQKVQQINDLQFEYCQHKYIYEDKYRKLDIIVKALQEQYKLYTQKRTLYMKKYHQLRELQGEFEQLRFYMMQALA